MAAKTTTDDRTTVGEFEIDPSEIDYDDRKRASMKPDGRNHRDHIKFSKEWGIWVAYRSSQTGPNEYTHTIKGIGSIDIEPPELDESFIAETIREEANRNKHPNPEEMAEEDTEIDDALDQLIDAADEVAANLHQEWRRGCETVVGDNLHEGTVNVFGTQIWVSHVEEAFFHETVHALNDADVPSDDEGLVRSAAQSGLYEAVRKKNNRATSGAEYRGEATFEVEPWKLRAIELEQNGVLRNKPELCKAKALDESGISGSEMSQKLDKHRSTVSRQLSQIEDWENRAEWTVENQ